MWYASHKLQTFLVLLLIIDKRIDLTATLCFQLVKASLATLVCPVMLVQITMLSVRTETAFVTRTSIPKMENVVNFPKKTNFS